MIQQIIFTRNLVRDDDDDDDDDDQTRTIFILEEVKDTILDFFQGTVEVLQTSSKSVTV